MIESLDIMKIIIVAVNVIILYLVMRRFLFKPITAFMENRSDNIKNTIEAADKARAEAMELKAQYEEQLKAAKLEAARIVDEARDRATREYDRIIDTAKKDSEGIILRAREEIKRERAEMLREVKNQVASLALAAASKVIQANMNTEKNRALVNRFIDEEGVA